MKVIKESTKSAIAALDLYDSVLDRIIPWAEFNATLVELDRFRNDYSLQSALLISEIRTLMLHGMDAYYSASQNVYEWAGLAANYLALYIKLFDHYSMEGAESQKQLLIDMLSDGVEKMSAAQDELARSSLSFNDIFGKLTVLLVRFEREFDEKSVFFQSKVNKLRTISKGAKIIGAIPGLFGLTARHFRAYLERNYTEVLVAKLESITQFYDDLKEKVRQAFRDIYTTKSILNEEIERIGELKIQTQQTQTFIGLDGLAEIRDIAIEHAQRLIEKCEDYRQSHINETNRN